MNKKKLSTLTTAMAFSLCVFSNTVMAAPSKILTFTNMPTWDYHRTNYDQEGNVRVDAEKTTFNLNGQEKANYIPRFNVKEVEVNSPIVIKCEFQSVEQRAWFNKVNKITREDSTKNPNLEQSLEFKKDGDSIIIEGNQRVLANNMLHNIKIYSEGYDSAVIPVNIVQAEPIKVLLSYPMNPRVGEDIRFKLENFSYAIINPVNRVFLTHNNNRKELVKLEDYHVISDLITIYSEDEENEEENIFEPGQYTLEIYAYGFKKAEKRFEVIRNEVKASEESNIHEKSQSLPTMLRSNSASSLSVDTISSASISVGEGADNSGSGEDSGSSMIMPCNLVYDHDLLANALILHELGMGTKESEGIVKRFEENTISYDAVINEDGTKINDFQDYLNQVKDASLNGQYLTYDQYIAGEESKEYNNRPYNVKQVLQDNLLGEAESFRDILGLPSPKLEVKTSTMDEDMIIQCSDTNYLNNIKTIIVNGDWRGIDESLYSIKDNQLIINNKLVTGDKIQLKILSTGYKDKVIEVDLQKVLDNIDLKLERDYQTGENIVVTGLTPDFIKNINSIKLDDKLILNSDQEGHSSDTCYVISGDKLTLRAGLFKEAKEYKLEIDGKYYGKKELTFSVAKREENPIVNEDKDNVEKKDLPKMEVKVVSKPGFMKQYGIRFENSGEWMEDITGLSVNGIEYSLGLSWGQTNEHYAVRSVDKLIEIGSDGFKDNDTNVITVKAEGYDDFTFSITKDGEIVLNKQESSELDTTTVVEEEKESTVSETSAVEEEKESTVSETPVHEEEKESTVIQENKELPQMAVTVDSKPGFINKYVFRFENSAEWMDDITGLSVNGVEYSLGLSWGQTNERYAIRSVDKLMEIGSDGFKDNDTNVITVKAEGYGDFTFSITKDGELVKSN